MNAKLKLIRNLRKLCQFRIEGCQHVMYLLVQGRGRQCPNRGRQYAPRLIFAAQTAQPAKEGFIYLAVCQISIELPPRTCDAAESEDIGIENRQPAYIIEHALFAGKGLDFQDRNFTIVRYNCSAFGRGFEDMRLVEEAANQERMFAQLTIIVCH